MMEASKSSFADFVAASSDESFDYDSDDDKTEQEDGDRKRQGILKETRKQIRKDIKRANHRSFSMPTLCDLLEDLDEAETLESMEVILAATVYRNPDIGYAQGMDHMCVLLLALAADTTNSNETVFWILNASIVNLRLRGFYKQQPSMQGYLIEKRMISYLVGMAEPELVDVDTKREEVVNLVEVMAPKWLISLFVDAVPLPPLLCILDLFFSFSGDVALIDIVLKLIVYILHNAMASYEPGALLDSAMEFCSELTLETFADVMQLKVYLTNSNPIPTRHIDLDGGRGGDLTTLMHIIRHRLVQLVPQILEYEDVLRELFEQDDITEDFFSTVIATIRPPFIYGPRLVHLLYQYVQIRGEQQRVTVLDLLDLISILCGESPHERLRLLFSLYDAGAKGFWSRDEFFQYVCDTLLVTQLPALKDVRGLVCLFSALEDDSIPFQLQDLQEHVLDDDSVKYLNYAYSFRYTLHSAKSLPGKPTTCIKKYAKIGLSFRKCTNFDGLRVTRVFEGGRAMKCGLKRGDIVTGLNEHPMKKRDDFL